MITTATNKRQQLIELSEKVKFMVEIGELEADSCNDALIMYYKRENPKIREFKTFNGWKEEGRFVEKGSKAFLIWGKKRKVQQETEEEKREYKFFPVAYLFADTQLKSETQKKENIATTEEIKQEVDKITQPQIIESKTLVLTSEIKESKIESTKSAQISFLSNNSTIEPSQVKQLQNIEETELEIIEEPQRQKKEKAFNTENRDFFPTPTDLCIKMVSKITNKGRFNILEPSAGSGSITDYLKEKYKYGGITIKCIEKDPKLIALLQSKNLPVIDRNFLEYSGNDQFDVIIMNPPFSDGDKHLLKAIDIMFNGEIICLLNAETLKNPYSNTRKLLLKKLNKLNASIEYIQDGFKNAQRKTAVETALVYIKIDNKIEDSFIHDMDRAEEVKVEDIKDSKDVSKFNDIESLVADYNKVIEDGKKVIMDFYKNDKIRHIISLKILDVTPQGGTITEQVKELINEYIKYYRSKYWSHLIDFQSISKKMTEKKIEEFRHLLSKNEEMDFTLGNIRAFIEHILDTYEDNLKDAVESLFDKMTISHAYGENLHTDNIHMFDGWKTNNAYKVGKKVILPMHGFRGYWGDRWEIDHRTREKINDIDKVMNFFDGNSEYISIADALDKSFNLEGPQTRNVKSTYFTISVFKKGTIHLQFNNMDILRRFNVEACKRKNFIPEDYGNKKYDSCTDKEKSIINSFENVHTYNKNVTSKKSLFAQKNLLKIN